MMGRGMTGRRITRPATWRLAATGHGDGASAAGPVRRRASRRFFCALALGLSIGPLVSACGDGGFRPMYAANLDGQSLSQAMAQVSVTTIPGRVGQRVRNELIFQTTGGGEAQEKAYKLDIVLRERLTSQLVDAQGDAELQIYHLDADFQLTERTGGAVILKGQSFGRAGFQRFQTIYSNVRAKRDAENRAARTVAQDVRTRIETALSRRQQL